VIARVILKVGILMMTISPLASRKPVPLRRTLAPVPVLEYHANVVSTQGSGRSTEWRMQAADPSLSGSLRMTPAYKQYALAASVNLLPLWRGSKQRAQRFVTLKKA
jgi:hypothetical protein